MDRESRAGLMVPQKRSGQWSGRGKKEEEKEEKPVRNRKNKQRRQLFINLTVFPFKSCIPMLMKIERGVINSIYAKKMEDYNRIRTKIGLLSITVGNQF